MTSLMHAPRSPLLRTTLVGLGVAVVGLLLQFAADPARFGAFPTGIYVIVAVAAITWFGRRFRWTPLLAVLLGLWITVGGLLGDQLQPNLTSPVALTVAGNLVMVVGLVVAVVAGVLTIWRNAGADVRPGAGALR